MTTEPVILEKKFRISEIFGPTIQGEGRLIGMPCYFVRVGGCDFRCSWCDTPYAVLPEYVNELPQLTAREIVEKLRSLPRGPQWVVISGGNPALFDLEELNARLHMHYGTMVETQGTIWHEWLLSVDDVCVSPKPPSAGNVTLPDTLLDFLDRFGPRWSDSGYPPPYLKVVVFDDLDYEYAQEIRMRFPGYEMFLSVGNEDPRLPTVGNPHPDKIPHPTDHLPVAELTQDLVIRKMRLLMEKVAEDPLMFSVRVLPQMHVLAWGNERGH